MSSNLYEVLGLERNATAEDIRKAYRKRALKTHPDRLPQGVSEAERQEANDQFRLVNNAYEVLNDTNNRKLYDRYGVWPPPTADAQPQAGPSYNNQDRTFTGFGGSNPFTNDPFFNSSPFGHPFHFTDPFELFTSFFGDIHRPGFSWGDSFDDSFGHPFMSSPFGAGPPGAAFGPRDPWGRPLMSGFGPFGGPSMLSALAAGGPNVRSYSSTTQTMGGGGNWVSQSTMSRTVNGRTETITTRRDAQGNEHVTRTSPEGETYTINGVEQPSTNGQPRSISAAPPPQPFIPFAAPLPPTMQDVVPPMGSVSRTSSQHSYSRHNYPYDQPEVNRRSSGSSHRKMYEDGVTRSSHDGHRPSRDDYYDPYRTRNSNPNYETSIPARSSSSQRRANVYAGVADNGGHHVGDSGSRHRDEHKHDSQRRGW